MTPVPDLRDEVIEAILTAERERPRSRQTTLGISEMGSSCDRKLVGKLQAAGGDAPSPVGGPQAPSSPWPAIMGTAVHDATLAPALSAWNRRHGRRRFLIELAVTLARDPLLTGHVDVFDTDSGTVLDHKLTSMANLKRVMAQGPGATYQTQAQGYGLALRLAGHDVSTVMILFYPRDGDLSQAYAWSAPFDPEIGLAALVRVTRLAEAAGQPAALARAATADDHCRSCTLHRPGVAESRPGEPFAGCPGVGWARYAQRPETEPPTTTAAAYSAATNRKGTR